VGDALVEARVAVTDLESTLLTEQPATLDLLARLVEQPSVEGNETAIHACLALVREAIEPLAYEIEAPVHAGLPALIARFGAVGGERLTLAGHIDVVPAEGTWTCEPFALTRRGGLLYGRGVTDMKGGVAASVGAIRALAAAGLLERCAIELVITGDEEVGSARGMQALLAAGQVTGAVAICPEPSGLDVFLGNRGIARFIVTIAGRGGHSGQLHALDSPLVPAARVVQALNELTFAARDERFSPPTPSIAVTWLAAGSDRTLNIVPDSVQIGIDRRLLPAETAAQATDELRAVLDEIVRPPYEYDLTPGLVWPPCETPPDHPLNLAAVRAVQASGLPGALGMDLASNDSSFLVQHGIPALLLGPGAPEQAHTTDEHLELAQLHAATEVYARLALEVARG
jgi:acetylornithine deacetylase/succinyl-diaminopimelate desuccinylase-like protein